MRSWLFAVALAGLAATAHGQAAKTADEVIARNIAARGGLEAWRKVNTLVYLGHIERANTRITARVPFVMQMQRPNLTRFEVKEQFNQYTRVFDGHRGWRIRPGSDGLPLEQPFSPSEVSFAQSEYVVDSPLIDFQAKGVSAVLDGIDRLDDGRRAYRLSLVLPGGSQRKVWVDVKSNLDVRYDRPATSAAAPGKPVSVYYSDFRRERGVVIPHAIATTAEAGRPVSQAADQLIIEKVLVNPQLDKLAFAPPPRPLRHGPAPQLQIPATAVAGGAGH
jgi:outer membrane lipoprotein-sorting protein